MSSGIILLLVAIVLIIIVAYLVSIIIRKRNDFLIDQLDSRKVEIFGQPIGEEIETVKKMNLIGQSQTAFVEWQEKWSDISKKSYTEIENHIYEAESLNDAFRFIKAKSTIDSIDSQLDLVSEDINAIKEALLILTQQEEKNSARVKHALDLYEVLQDSITETEDNFGATMPEIQKQLSNIEAEFSQFVTLNTTGDPVEAANILDKAEEHTIALGQITENIPAIVAKLEDDFPDQLDDLENGYRKLLEQNYHFKEEQVEIKFQEIRSQIKDTSEELATLDLDKAVQSNEHIQKQIDHLYQLFEEEIAAHKEVVKSAKIIPSFIEHSKANNIKLFAELKRLSKQYILSETDSLNLRSFEEELTELEEEIVPLTVDLENQDKPFSVLEKEFAKALKSLKRIEEGQMDVFEDIKDIDTGVDKARQNLDLYINKLHTIKRFMEKRNLPGIPQEFLSTFFTASSQLETLMDELDRSRINIESVTRLSQVSTNAMDNLEQTAYRVIQNATLTEQLLQYSNRYRSFEVGVQESFERSLHLFEVENDYQGSFDEISYALEAVEPGVTERFVSSYEKTQEKIRF